MGSRRRKPEERRGGYTSSSKDIDELGRPPSGPAPGAPPSLQTLADRGVITMPNAPAVPTTDRIPDVPRNVATPIPPPARVRMYTVLVLWQHDGGHPRHQVVRSPGPGVGDAVANALTLVEKDHPQCAITHVKAWPCGHE